MSYNPNIKTLLQLEKPWWKPTQPQFLVPRHMLSGTARSEGVAKLRAKNGALFQASGSEQVEGMIRVCQNTKAWGSACNLQNHHFQFKSHLQRGSRLRKKWMKITLPIPVFRFHISFWVCNHSVNGGIHFWIVKELCPIVPTQRVLRYSSPGHCLKRLSMTFCPLALWVGRIKSIWQQRRLPSRSLT